MDYKQHRLYSYMSEPVKVIGMTLDELILALVAVFIFLMFDSLMLKAIVVGATPALIFMMKKFKKLNEGFCLASFIHWNLGVRFDLPFMFPVSWKRKWHG